MPSSIIASSAQEKLTRQVLAPEPSAKKALPGTKATFADYQRFCQQRGTVHACRQGQPDEHAAFGPRPADAVRHVFGRVPPAWQSRRLL